jgi:hypothetical protein
LRQELPGWLREDPEFRQWILNFTCNEFTDRRETESRFDRILDECVVTTRRRSTNEKNKTVNLTQRWAKQIAKPPSPQGNNGDGGSAGP